MSSYERGDAGARRTYGGAVTVVGVLVLRYSKPVAYLLRNYSAGDFSIGQTKQRPSPVTGRNVRSVRSMSCDGEYDPSGQKQERR